MPNCEHRRTLYFCDGLILQYLPKGTDQSVFSQDERDAIAHKLEQPAPAPALRMRIAGCCFMTNTWISGPNWREACTAIPSS